MTNIDIQYTRRLLRGSNYDMYADDAEIAVALAILGHHNLAIQIQNAANEQRLAKEAYDAIEMRPATEVEMAEGFYAGVMGVLPVDPDAEAAAFVARSEASYRLDALRQQASTIADAL